MLQVKWKAAATAVTGATALAGWLAAPPEPTQRKAAPAARPAEVASTTSIEQQAERLASRVAPRDVFQPPRRNLFQFPPAAPAASKAARTPLPPQPTVAPPAPFPFRLSGTASDDATGATVWTAILSGGASGLVLTQVGEMVGGFYRVERIDDTTADLVDVRDGRTIRLALSR